MSCDPEFLKKVMIAIEVLGIESGDLFDPNTMVLETDGKVVYSGDGEIVLTSEDVT